MKRAILTGGTGMIGHALIERLVHEKVEVTVLARKNSKRMVFLPKHEMVDIVECDLSDLADVRLPDREYDVFYHFGWDGTFGDARNDMFLQNNNVKYTLDAVRLAYRAGCKLFVGAGSQAEYGRVDEKITSSTPTTPENGYGIAKLCAGQMSRIMAASYGIKHIWTRILSVYGPYDGNKTMIMSAIEKLCKGERVSCTKGEQIWDYLYSKDAAKMMYLIGCFGVSGKIYCLGSGTARPLKKYIEAIRDIINPNAEIGFGDIAYSPKQVMYLCADIQELINDTGYECDYSFESGIEETVEWYKNHARKGDIKIMKTPRKYGGWGNSCRK